MKKILLVSFVTLTTIIANPMNGAAKHVVKHNTKSSVKDKTSINKKSKKDGLDLDKKKNKMERKAKTKAIKAVL